MADQTNETTLIQLRARESSRIQGANSLGGPADAAPRPIRATNSPLPLDEAIQKVEEQEAGLSLDYSPVSDIRVVEGGLITGGKELILGEDGYRRLCNHLRAPRDYLSRLGPQMRSRLLNYHLKRNDFTDRKLAGSTVRVVSRGGTFLDINRADLCTLGGADVLRAVRDAVGGPASPLGVQRLLLRGEAFEMDLVSEHLSEDVRPGDVLRGGLHVEHSSLGERATTIMAYVLRLLCSNGLVHRECVGARKTPRTRRIAGNQTVAREQQLDQVRRLAAGAWRGLSGTLGAIRQLQDRKLESDEGVLRVFEQFLRRARLYSENLMGLLRRAWSEELGGNGERTYFGVLNALTWLATHSQEALGADEWLSDRQAGLLARLSGVFANQTVHICPACFRMTSAG